MRSRKAIGAAAALLLATVLALAAFQSPAVRAVDEKVLREYAGVYQWAPDSFAYLQLWHEFSGFERGVGESTGDWNTASFDDLAGDVVAAFEYLKTRRDIDQAQIGVLGISQAGWIMPLAAVRAKDLAFLISISGAGVPAWRNPLRDRPRTPRDGHVAQRFAENDPERKRDERHARHSRGGDQRIADEGDPRQDQHRLPPPVHQRRSARSLRAGKDVPRLDRVCGHSSNPVRRARTQIVAGRRNRDRCSD
jgi:hypothetical protein